VPLDRGAHLGRSNQEELVTLALDGEAERRLFQKVRVGRFQPLAGHASRSAQLFDGGALSGSRP